MSASVPCQASAPKNIGGRPQLIETQFEDAKIDLLLCIDPLIDAKRAAIRAQIAELQMLERRREQIRMLRIGAAA